MCWQVTEGCSLRREQLRKWDPLCSDMGSSLESRRPREDLCPCVTKGIYMKYQNNHRARKMPPSPQGSEQIWNSDTFCFQGEGCNLREKINAVFQGSTGVLALTLLTCGHIPAFTSLPAPPEKRYSLLRQSSHWGPQARRCP